MDVSQPVFWERKGSGKAHDRDSWDTGEVRLARAPRAADSVLPRVQGYR